MAASYPTSVKSFSTKAAADTIQAAHVNDLQDEVTAIETALLTSGLAHAVTITAGAGGASLTLPATGRLYLDGGSNTYLYESSADNLALVAGGTVQLTLSATLATVSGQLILAATNKVYLDGGSNTFINEASADTIALVAGGTTTVTVTTSGISLSGQTVTFGANDTGGTGYRALVVPNS